MAKSETTKLAKFIKTSLAAVLIVGASVGATLFYYSSQTGLGKANAEAPSPAAAAVPAPIFTPLEPFTVTLRGERGSRALYVAITLRVADTESRKVLTDYMPEVRDRVLLKLSEQSPEHVQTQQGREQLVQSLMQMLAQPYHPQPEGPHITQVLFTAFVVQ